MSRLTADPTADPTDRPAAGPTGEVAAGPTGGKPDEPIAGPTGEKPDEPVAGPTGGKPGRAVSLADIAAAAGTTVATVSKVLNGRPGISDDRRAQISRLLDERGYRRRGAVARSPARLIDVVVRGIDTQWSNQILTGAEEEAARLGAGIVVTATHGQLLGNRQWLAMLARRHSDGLILVVSRLSQGVDGELAKLRIPYVLLDPIGAGPQSVPVIGAANFAGGLAATEHLLQLGHRRIGIITGEADMRCSQERLDGYRAALGRAAVVPDDALVRPGDFLSSGGYKGALELLRLEPRPTAVFAGSDLQASGVYQAAAELGLRIPQDLSVVGFDDVPLCGWVTPKLTTVHQPIEEMARQATRILLALAYRGTPPPQPKLELATRLVVRQSTAPPPGV
ncbi:MAG: substrate-binding domain-containing protein [Propionibacteriaceae bacterium]|jgi:LacI family transcriptional regulator|nr:substrate-binding domain-containing protein [Propionibacteriaceae bacterium]